MIYPPTMSWWVKNTLYQLVIVSTVTCDDETWHLREAERLRFNVIKMKCLRPMVEVTRGYRIKKRGDPNEGEDRGNFRREGR